jgi:hypothetical protein
MSDAGGDATGRRPHVDLRHFEGIWPTELAAIGARREKNGRNALRRNEPTPTDGEPVAKIRGPRSPDPNIIFPVGGDAPPKLPPSHGLADPKNPDRNKMRPQPVPCNATGLALSGGGIRSAAVCLGVLQAISKNNFLRGIDYLSTVSGGGYIGSSLSAAMSQDRDFPFGDDIRDNDVIAHLRNYSNYLMPRGRSLLRNGLEAAVLILRGLLANAVIVAAWLLGAVLLTWRLYPPAGTPTSTILLVPTVLAGALGVVLLAWTMLRSFGEREISNDTSGGMLEAAYWLSIAVLLATFVFLQPLIVRAFIWLSENHIGVLTRLKEVSAVLAGFAVAVSACSSALGHFLKKSERATASSVITLRILTKAMVVAVACILPLGIYLLYLWLASAAVAGWSLPGWLVASLEWFPEWLMPNWPPLPRFLLAVILATAAIGFCFGPNSYSLHRFYRDRLSKAFIFRPVPGAEPAACDTLKLSQLRGGNAPYHIINAAMNVQGSADANRRGRDADFFIFTPDFVGSDLTMYAGTAPPGHVATAQMEKVDPQLDLATAMAISGAAISANAGSNTIRALSPSLALLNVRLGYWLANPRFLAQSATNLLLPKFDRIWAKFYQLAEMLNLLSEKSPVIYLTDGGHIENLGLYELLKRGCQAIIVVDAEADPHMAFPSLLKVERFARIDLGVRIQLPWEDIATYTRWASSRIAIDQKVVGQGPHCAVGRVFYADGAQGVLLYFKSSFTGDEKDYIVDYKRRNPQFPHETTSDQFFTEEQFEMYRGLGFHMADGFFTDTHVFSFLDEAKGGFASAAAALAEVTALLR